MDPPTIGSGCSHTECHNHDFLPIKCPTCNKLYCSDHYFQDAHECQSDETLDNNETASAERSPVSPCSFEGCTKPCLESYVSEDVGESCRTPALCSRCSLAFCSIHRFPESHACKGPVPTEPVKNEAARALLAKNFPMLNAGKSEQSSQPPTGPYTKKRQKSQASKTVQLMKMRQTAVPGDPKSGQVPPTERHHVQAKINTTEAYKCFWFRKSVSTGRAFDLLQQRLQASPVKTWTLYKELDESDEPPILVSTFDKPLSEEFEDGCKLLLVPS
ncbi:uncharacterized protein FOMMEDRAFT_152995 [Fomitiporia mediterranea MF3/22]|uniref:uncharacterized protein n=1 Tax=Fomitiporia mediterranea (strain MF3/22) TaxID=694068 RepID=UPI0004407942|nr:uncharacterized protein FOMMEDRAFT_152995 [Fomitiporia mediterranea MF3/22]EJD05662.1 hypothetical protein FOMMEDRAFT_152995 [Fomitiporia mediterranea MF3/22]